MSQAACRHSDDEEPPTRGSAITFPPLPGLFSTERRSGVSLPSPSWGAVTMVIANVVLNRPSQVPLVQPTRKRPLLAWWSNIDELLQLFLNILRKSEYSTGLCNGLCNGSDANGG